MSAPRARRATWIALAALVLLAMLAGLAVARPGGGESYSGGGGHSSGGGGGGGDSGDGGALVFELVFQLIRLCFYYPSVGVPILVVVVVILVVQSHLKKQTKDWDSGPPVAVQRTITLDPVKQLDPDFSSVLFTDFAARLYATAHQTRHDDRQLDAMAPYVGPSARAALRAREPRGPVTGVIVGAMRPYFVNIPLDPSEPGAFVVIGLEYEANYTVESKGKRHTWYVVERWRMGRAVSARTRPRDLARGFPCPSCGAPWQAKDTAGTQACSSCNEVVDNGRFDWQVIDVELLHAKDQPPLLTAEVPERGNDVPTYYADDVDAAWASLSADDPAVTKDALIARLRLIYGQVNDAWAANDLSPARPFVSDGLYDYLSYWVEAYRSQGLVNRLEGMRITQVVFARVVRDRWYDAVTIRLWATGRDFVVRQADGAKVRGSASTDRPYSEYWTLIRSAGRRGPTKVEPACGNCGAPAKVGMAGACEFCGAHVTSGEFDWVLSRIEQDDSYRG